MENEIEKKVNAEDEISLLDLFAVLIRNRKLIIFGTLIVSFIAGLYLFIVPLFVKKLNVQTVTVTYTVDVKPIPSIMSAKLSSPSPLYLSTYNAQRLPFLVDQLKKNNVFVEDDGTMSDYDFNKFVQTIKKDGKIKVNNSPLGNGYDIVLEIPFDKIDDSRAFVKSIVADTEVELQNYILPLIATLNQNTNLSIEKATLIATSVSDMSALQALQDLSVAIDDFTETFDQFLTLREEPFVVPEGRGRTKKFVIIFFASFFIFVFAAFCKNAVINIKADPESRKLISDAWKEGK